MNGIHDMGGMDGFGPVAPGPDEPVFHQAWEARVFALSLAAGGQMPFTIETFRHMREEIDPVSYLGTSYYEHWLAVLERQVLEAELVTGQELEARLGDLMKEGS